MFVKQQSNRPEEVSLSAQNTRVVMVRANVGLSYLLFCFVCDVFFVIGFVFNRDSLVSNLSTCL